MNLFGGTLRNLEQSLDYAAVKNKTIANNIANVDTPNYKSQNVRFKDELDRFMGSSIKAKQTHPRHLSFESQLDQKPYDIYTNPSTLYNHNGNNVDIDKEMSELAKNQIYYQAAVDRLNGKFGSLQTVIRGGR
ncbi:flagellar basal body rod protein FlgB [Lentibacillus saliphilus]|uniref:flagellar basal body rod protein FlgB n=1 Tax=Lentibacillus saliphilus TaxID=2737028 RepID=UPI001C30DB0B|nr:flagellar basal body rod protein FlgB [Lentibacillus saliphilus]